MFKLFLLIMSLNFFNFDKEENFEFIYEEFEKEEIVQTIDEYSLILNEKFYLKSSNNIIEIGEYEKAKMFFINNELIIIASSYGGLYKISVNRDLELKDEIVLIREGITSDWNGYMENEKIYLFGKSNERNENISNLPHLSNDDCFFFVIENNNFKENYYGGSLNEEFINGLVINEEYYICGFKNSLGDGDFGNGGKYEKNVFITKINQEFNVDKSIVLDENEDIIGIFEYKNIVYLVLENSIYCFNKSLDLVNKKVNNYRVLVSKMSEEGILALFSENLIELIDLNNNTSEKIDLEFKIEEAYLWDEFIVLKSGNYWYIADVICLEEYCCKENYNVGFEKLFSLFGVCSLNDVSFSPYLDYQVYGEYDVSLKYETIGGIGYTHLSIHNIEKEVNVVNGGIYPLGYRLRFTGKGYLDGKMIYNNYQLSTEGKHILELIGANSESEQISFEVNKNQIEFNDIEKRNSDVEVERGEKFSLKFNLKIDEKCKITKVIINGEEYTDLAYEEKNCILFVRCDPLMEEGIYTYNIERVYYSDEINEYSKKIEEKVIVNVLNPRLKMNLINLSENLFFYIDCTDYYNTARYFKIVAYNQSEEYVYNFPISNNEILLKNLKNNTDYKVDIYMVSDINSHNLISTPIMNLSTFSTNGEIYVGSIKILKFEDSLQRFCIEIDEEFMEKELEEIIVSGSSVFINNRTNLKGYIFFCISSFLIGIVLIAIFSFGKKKQ